MSELAKIDETEALILACEMADLYGLDYAQFAIVGEQTLPKPVVAYVGRMGINLGHWDDIVGKVKSPVPADAFTVRIGNDEYDTRQGMTFAVYSAVIKEDHNQLLPDHYLTAIKGGMKHPRTWLTGEKAKPHWAPTATIWKYEADGSPMPEHIGVNRHSAHSSFRPAAVLLG
jgi:hypothetical protein